MSLHAFYLDALPIELKIVVFRLMRDDYVKKKRFVENNLKPWTIQTFLTEHLVAAYCGCELIGCCCGDWEWSVDGDNQLLTWSHPTEYVYDMKWEWPLPKWKQS